MAEQDNGEGWSSDFVNTKTKTVDVWSLHPRTLPYDPTVAMPILNIEV